MALKQWSYFAFRGLRIVKYKVKSSIRVESSKYSDQATGWRIEIRFPAGAEMFSFAAASVPALEPIKSPIQRVPRTFSPWVKLPEREAKHSFSSGIENEKRR